jgi:hypothetical protein
LSRLLDKTRVEASHTNAKHATTISALRRELGQTRQTLDQALEVRADDAERFLDLIDAAPNQGSNFGSGMVTGASEEEEDEINGHEMHVPASKTEAILAFAADQPGGTNARARQRSNDRRRRLDNALSTIAVSRSSKMWPNAKAFRTVLKFGSYEELCSPATLAEAAAEGQSAFVDYLGASSVQQCLC